MYREDYRDDYDRDLESSRSLAYSREIRDPYYERARDRAYDFDDRDRGLRSAFPPPPPPPPILDDPYYRRLEELEARAPAPLRPRETPIEPSLEPGAEVLGSVVLIPLSPFEAKPKKRDKPPNCDTVFVGSLPDNTTEQHLYDLFSMCGKINDVRVSRSRNFGHVQFTSEAAVDKATELSGCRIRISPTNTLSKIHVDYAQPKGEAELQKRIQDAELMIFNPTNASTVSSDLHRDEAFAYAAKNVMHWIERGNCNPSTSNTFFGLISSVNVHSRKIAKIIKAKEEEAIEFARKKREYFENLIKDCESLSMLSWYPIPAMK